MKYYNLSQSNTKISSVIQGCMRLKGKTITEVEQIIRTDMEQGINHFDHADVYGSANARGECEELFGTVLQSAPSLRGDMYIQSKCGIRKSGKGYYDFSKTHIIEATNAILSRLKIEYLDAMLLHRPDALMEAEEVAEAFDYLYQSGKVKNFGVSNMNGMQIELLKQYVKQPIVFNQMQLSIAHSVMIDAGLSVNNHMDQSIDYGQGCLEYAQLNNIIIQAWSPFQKGFFEGTFIGDLQNYKELNEVLDSLAKKYEVTNTAIAVAWILRHPAHMQVILGTTNIERIKDAGAGSEVTLSREEWYQIYTASGKKIL